MELTAPFLFEKKNVCLGPKGGGGGALFEICDGYVRVNIDHYWPSFSNLLSLNGSLNFHILLSPNDHHFKK